MIMSAVNLIQTYSNLFKTKIHDISLILLEKKIHVKKSPVLHVLYLNVRRLLVKLV